MRIVAFSFIYLLKANQQSRMKRKQKGDEKMGYLLTNGDGKYISYANLEIGGNSPEAWGSAIITGCFDRAKVYSTAELAETERSRLRKKAKGFYAVETKREKNWQTERAEKKNNEAGDDVVIAISKSVEPKAAGVKEGKSKSKHKTKKECRRKAKLLSVAVTEYSKEAEEAFTDPFTVDEQNQSRKTVCRSSERRIFTKEERTAVYRKNEGHCYLCGEFVDYDGFEIEHFKPLSKKPVDDDTDWNDISNLNVVCHKCNRMKADLWYDEFIDQMKKIINYQEIGKG